MLEVHNLSAAYGQSEVLHSIDLSAKAGEIVALVGRNGMGKSTLMKSLIGASRTGSLTCRKGGRYSAR
jgi:urea transport system ATP-binding protein